MSQLTGLQIFDHQMAESTVFNKSCYSEEYWSLILLQCVQIHTFCCKSSKRTVSDTLVHIAVRNKSMWTRPTWSVDLLCSCVGGEHLTRELVLLLPVVVLQVVHQHDISSLLHRHHLTEHLQLQHSNINMCATCTLGLSHNHICTTVAKQNTCVIIIKSIKQQSYQIHI